MSIFVDDMAVMGLEDRDYDRWLGTLTEASERLDTLQTTLSEVRCLCESRHADAQQILDLLQSRGV